MHSSDKTSLTAIGIILAVILILALVLIGPRGCERRYASWSAAAYGSDWLVVQYAQDGSIISSWELSKKSVGNEDSSDGIFFIDNDDNVVHLSGHYVYIEVKSPAKLEKLRERLLK